ncbi:YihY/virulence factor BrkB family protein [Clostridium omnivorum]|uniref:YihY/virulence factor BrkB family protein n=1 Tax=Clostridium omnivorum TaxID=1604902 RepID=A0ABQ5N144_9CLOT|nr:YihY/virulence factor BrkB family protein [Clostridium sp. E14]GLC28935.1 hypothetical protein bsdE14_03450 [Clostridium sp. E14]
MKNLILDLIQRFNKDDVPALAYQLAYKLVLSFFPFIIFLMTIIGYTSLNKLEILIGLSNLIPQEIYNLIKYTVIELNNAKSGSILSLSLIFTLWSASSGFNGVIKGINKAYGVKESRSYIKVRVISLLCTLGMVFVIIIMGILLVLGNVIWRALTYNFSILAKLTSLWLLLRYTIVVFTAIFIFTALYTYAPSKRLNFWEAIPGSLFSTLGLASVSIAFSFYVNNFGRYSVVYGSIGAVLILLLWLFFVSNIIILGGELNASLVSLHTVTKGNDLNL